MTQVGSVEADVGIEEQQVNVDERATVTTLVELTFGCKKGIGSKPCSPLTISCRCEHLALSSLALSLTWLWCASWWLQWHHHQISVTTEGEGSSESGLLFSPPGETDLREDVKVSSHHRWHPLCTRTWRRVFSHKDSHGNTKRSPAHALSFSSTEFVVRFLLNYPEQNALLLPGVPGYSSSDIKLLPSSVSKRGIWRCTSDSMRVVGYSTFTNLWRCLLPLVILMNPMTDLCWAVSKGEHSHTAFCQPLRGREVRCSTVCTGASAHRPIGAIIFHRLLRRLLQIRESPLPQPYFFLSPSSFQPHPPPTQTTSKSTKALTMHSRFVIMIQKSMIASQKQQTSPFSYHRSTSPATPCSQVPSTFLLRGSAQCSEYTAKLYLAR